MDIEIYIFAAVTAGFVASRIVDLHEVFGNSRILIQMAIATVPHTEQM